MFGGFGRGRGTGRPGNSSNVPQLTNGAHGRGDGTEADTGTTADQPCERSGSPDIPNAQELQRRARTARLDRQAQAAEYMERLRNNAEAALLNTQDVQLQDIIRRSHLEIQQMPGRIVPTSTEAIRLVARILEFANQRMEPRQAAIYLAHAHWDYRGAVSRYIAQVFDDDDEDSLSDPGSSSGGEAEEEEEEEEGQEEEEEGEAEEVVIDKCNNKKAVDRALMRRLNKHLSRKGPIKGQRDDSLLVVRFRKPRGKPDEVKRYKDVHGEPVDWDENLRKISRWRSQVFRRALGPIRKSRAKYHELEKQWLINAHIDFERRCREAGVEVNWRKMNWTEVAADFNHRFQGQILPGDPRPRPARSSLSLRNERARIKEIIEISGLRPKGHPQE